MSLKAQCACRALSIELSDEPVRCFVCHCDYCQRMTGSVGNGVAVFREEDVLGTSGEFIEHDPKLENWPDVRKYLCPDCYSTVHWINPKAFPNLHLVSLGCLDNPSDFKLARTVQNKHRPSWCPEMDSPETLDEYPS